MAAYEVLLLNTAIPQIQAAQAGDTYVVPRDIAFSTVASFAAGLEATPSIVATGDVNTGIWFPAADTVAISTGGVSRVRLDASGNLGLGVTPSAWGGAYKALQLDAGSFSGNAGAIGFEQNAFHNGSNWIYRSNGAASHYETYGGGHYFFTAPSGTAGNAITFIQAMTLDASGNLGVGETSPSTFGKLVVKSGTISLVTDTASQRRLSFYSTANGNSENAYIQVQNDGATTNTGEMLFATKNTGGTLAERARITSGGYFKASNTGTYVGSTGTYHELRSNANETSVIVQNTSATLTQSVNGIQINYSGASPNSTSASFLYCNDSTALRAEIRSDGGLANYSANNVNLASDERLKKDISSLASTWDKLKTIEVVNFRYKDCNEGDPLLYGVIAQQVQPIVPDLVVVTKNAQEAIEAKDAVLDADGNVVEPAVAAKEATPEYYGIREQPMYWLAIKALQEAMARIEQLEAKVAALEAN